jgi:hypothetical protein
MRVRDLHIGSVTVLHSDCPAQPLQEIHSSPEWGIHAPSFAIVSITIGDYFA